MPDPVVPGVPAVEAARDAAINAVARALCDHEEAAEEGEDPWYGWSTDDLAAFTAGAALAAALPHLREQVADDLRNVGRAWAVLAPLRQAVLDLCDNAAIGIIGSRAELLRKVRAALGVTGDEDSR